MNEKPILQIRQVEKRFPGNYVLRKIDLDVYPGEVLGLIGENGAGKSTLMKIITGVYSLDGGEIIFEGQKVSFQNTKEALASGIAIIHQEFNLFQNLSVAENIFLDRDGYHDKWGRVDWKKTRQEARRILKELGAEFDVDTQVSEIGVREQQLIEIAKAISSNAKVIIMDEPSAALPQNEVGHLFDVIRLLKERGCSIIYVSHRMKEIEEICDRVAVLRNGTNVGTMQLANTNMHEIITLMCGREITDYYPHVQLEPGDVALQVEGLTNQYVKNVSFRVHKKEILGIYGLAGSGSVQLAECIFGLNRFREGKIVTVKGTAEKHTPEEAMSLGIAYVPPDRRREGIIKELSVEKNLILPQLRRYSKAGFLTQKKIKSRTQEYMKQLNILAVNSRMLLDNLSGGNQQKVVLARWLDVQPDVLILNEPTRGVDIGAKVEIYALIDKLAQQGLSIVMISSEIPEVIGMCDRVIVMNKGRISGTFASSELNQEVLLNTASVAQGKEG